MNRIRELRVAAGWRQQDLADKLKMAKTAVSKFELEQNDLSTEVIWKLCDVFGVTADYLLGRSSNPAPAISDEDAALLRAYHAAPPSVVAGIQALLQPYTQEKEADQAI